MSNFKSLPTDNSKTGPSEDSIFYRSQSTMTDQYKNARLEQQKKQKELLSAVNPPNTNNNNNNNNNNKRKMKLKPIRRIALGGNRNRNNRSNLKTTLTTNKPVTKSQTQLLRNYKKEYSRQQYDSFKKEELPPGTLKCSLFKKSLACNRAYIGHFNGSKGPRFPKSKIKAIREDDLQTQLERIQYDRSLNAKRREELIAKLKFGLEDEDDKRRLVGGREWWFEFQEAPNANLSNNKDEALQEKEEELRRQWLGKPKQKDKNYSYVLMEWTGTTRTATVYPATFIEFGLSKQLISDGQSSAESVEKRHRQQLANWRKKQAEKSMMEKLGNLFGHDEYGNVKEKRRKLKADEITDEAKEKLKEMYVDKRKITNEEMDMLKDMLGEQHYNLFIQEYNEHHSTGNRLLQTGDDSSKSLIKDKILSNRIKSTKRRGQLEELGDFDEFMSDDEDENNLNDYDLLDDNEEDILSNDDGNESENNEEFKKLKKNIGEDLANKEYELPEKEIKNGLFDNDSDDDDVNDVTWEISEDDDDDHDLNMDGNVTIKSSKNKKNDNKSGINNKGNAPNTNGDINGKKRKLDNRDNKGGPKKKKRKLNAVDEQKLKEELKILITKILKKFTDGLEMLDLWRKITATLSAEAQVIKKVLPPVLKQLAQHKTINGKKKYCLKEKYK